MKQRIILLAICFLALGLAKGLWGESKVNCDQPNTQAAMQTCANIWYKKSDVELNAVYKEVMAKASPAVKSVLVDAQRKWIVFRDKHCEIYNAIYEGGSMAPLQNVMCLKNLTESRTKELKLILNEIIR